MSLLFALPSLRQLSHDGAAVPSSSSATVPIAEGGERIHHDDLRTYGTGCFGRLEQRKQQPNSTEEDKTNPSEHDVSHLLSRYRPLLMLIIIFGEADNYLTMPKMTDSGNA